MQTNPHHASASDPGSSAVPSGDRAVFVLAGGAVFAISVAVLFGWLIQNPLLVRLHPSFVPMPLNASLAFGGAGSALLFAGLGRGRMSAFLGAAACLFGALASYPGHWFVGTHLAFAAAGAGFAALALGDSRTRLRVLGWSGSLTASIGAAAAAGYFFESYHHLNVGTLYAQMAFHAALAFLLMGGVFVWAGWKRENPNLPLVLVICAGMFIAFHIHLALEYADQKIGQKNFQYDAHDRVLLIEKEIESRLRLEAYRRRISPKAAASIEGKRWLDMSAILEHTLGGLTPTPADVYIFEPTAGGGERVLAYFGSKLRKEPEQALNAEEVKRYSDWQYREPIHAGANTWEVACLYVPGLDSNRRAWLPWAASGAVAGFAALLAYVLRSMIYQARIISDTVQQRTAQLEKANQALEEEIRQRRVAEAKLEEQRHFLEKANAELDSFVYTASHDLRAPLRAIASFASFLQEDCGERLDAQGKDHLNEIRKGALRMNQLIDDLLTLSRFSRVRNPFEPAPIGGMVKDVLERIRFDLQSTGAEVVVAPDLPVILCDRVKLTEVFLNLITNAVKFSSKNKLNQGQSRGGRTPKVEVGWSDRGDRWEFFVKDNGIGIEPKYHDQIFGIFKRLHPNDSYEGTGVGLSIVKRVVEDHGGRVWVESELGRGATFKMILPKTPGGRAS